MGKINLNNKFIKQQPNELLTESAQSAENNAANAAEAMDIFKKFNRQSNSDNAEKEIVELRTINSKSVRTKEGTVRQTIFPSAVHYVDENGIMQDIDNTLIERGDSYVINNGESGVKLAKNLYDKTLLSLKKGDIELNWKYLTRYENQFCALSVNNGVKTRVSDCNAKACESKGLFSDVEKGVDLEYKFDCGNIKENFIVKERLDSYSFAFELDTKGIEPRLSENGKSIEFVSNVGADSEKVIYNIPTPYMYDSKGNFSADVSYEIDDLGSGKYTFTIKADDNWINAANRVFPVVIDPMIVNFYKSVRIYTTVTDFETGEVTENTNDYIGLVYINKRLLTSTVYVDGNQGVNTRLIKDAFFVIEPSTAFGGGRRFTINDQTYNYEDCFPIKINVKNNLLNNTELVLELSLNTKDYDASGESFFLAANHSMEIEYYDNDKYFRENQPLLDDISVFFQTDRGVILPYFSDTKHRNLDKIKHYYNIINATGNCGNFCLNIGENFKTTSNGYAYTDEKGDNYGFKESYYYFKNGERVIVDKQEVTANADGKLYYNDYEVKKSVVLDNGLRAITQYSGIKNLDLIDQRIDEEKQLQEQVDTYYDAMCDFVSLDSNTGLKEYYLSDNLSSFEKFNTFLNQSGNITLPRSEAINYKAYIKQINAYNNQIDTVNLQKETLSINKEAMQYSKDAVNYQKINHNNLKFNREHYNDEQTQRDNNRNINTNLSNQFANLGDQLNNINSQIEISTASITDLNNQINILSENINYLVDKSAKYEEQLKDYYRIYASKNKELIDLKRAIPVSYLTDGTNYKGFNKDGFLVVIYDGQGSYSVIERDENNKAVLMSSNDGCDIMFNYSNNKLISIRDQDNNTVDYTYSGNDLIKVQYDDGHFYKFSYNGRFFKSIESMYGKVDFSMIEDGVIDAITINPKNIAITDGSTVIIDGKQRLFNVSYTTDLTIMEEDDVKYIFQRLKEGENRARVNCVEKAGKVVDAKGYAKEVIDECTQYSEAFAWDYFLNLKPFENYRFAANRILAKTYNPLGFIKEEINISTNGEIQDKKILTYIYDKHDKINKTKFELTVTPVNQTPIEYCNETDYFYDDDDKLIRTEGYYIDEKETKGVNVCEYVYGENYELLKEIQYNTLESTSKVIKEYKYDEINNLIGEYGESGDNLYNYEFSPKYGDLSVINQPNGGQMAYGYDNNGNLTSISSNTESGEANHNELYYTRDYLTKMVSGNNTVEYSYDHKGRQISLKINSNTPYLTTVYTDDYDYNGEKADLSASTYVNGDIVSILKNKNGKVLETSVNEEIVAKYTYVKFKFVKSIKNEKTGNLIRINYDLFYNPTGYTQTLGLNENFEYDNFGNVAKESYNLGDINGTYDYAYSNDAENNLTEITHGDTKVKLKHDVLGRNKGNEIIVGDNKIADESIFYKKSGDNTTGLVSSIRYGNNVNGKAMSMDGVKYEYDSVSNITKVFQNGELISTYDYDFLGRLVRENHKKAALTFVYEYDNYGNITTKRTYPYTLGNVEENDCEELIRYGYDGDKLMLWNDLDFEYDSIGNPIVYRGKAAVWANIRHLQSYDGVIFTYDEVTGLRKSKNNIEYLYFLDGRLLAQGNDIQFFYDHTGVAGIEQEAVKYFYRKNAQGDVISILDSNGEVVVQYVYDAWGNHSVCNADGTENSDIAFIGNINPFRYRSYYYDKETGLYYLKTRYYDPQIGRFMNADDIAYLDPETINGLNLYAYCLNNPLKYIDPTGHFPFLIALLLGLGFVAGGVVGGSVAYNNAVESGKTGSDLIWSTIKGVFIGGAIGFAGTGLLIATGGAIWGAVGASGLMTQFLGVTAIKAFAIGALAYNSVAMIVAPIIGITMEPIEVGVDPYKSTKQNEYQMFKYNKTLALSSIFNLKNKKTFKGSRKKIKGVIYNGVYW